MPLDLDTFLHLPAEEIARLLRQEGGKVCVFPINGTRRWFLLEHAAALQSPDPYAAYMDISGRNHLDLYRLFFEHGVDTLLTPIFGMDILLRGDEYMQRIGAEGLSRLAVHPDFLEFYRSQGVRVHFYGSYRRHLQNTPYAWLLDQFEAVTRQTRHNTRSRLFFGVFGNDPGEDVAAFAVDFFQRNQRLPTREEIIASYYGEYVEPVSFFIGFDRFSAFDMPLVALGGEDLYFTASPSPYLSAGQLRHILYDHLYTRRSEEPDYAEMKAEDLAWMQEFYTTNREATLGIGSLRGGIWYPLPQVRWPETQ